VRRHPHLLEINTRLLLERLSLKYRRPMTLGTVPSEEWERLREQGFDMLWLMGVWQRSPGARAVALSHGGLHQVLDETLPGWTDKDVAGSPYAIASYTLDPELGRPEELPALKKHLNYLGLRLILDFVPNHVALDHPWTAAHPDWFVHPKSEAAGAHPDWFFTTPSGHVIAHGRDPYFPPWTDTAQLNFFSPDLRTALTGELIRVSELSDGLRCDMAMLGLNRVFDRVWTPFAANAGPLAQEFWSEAISQVRRNKPDFIFLAEAYWDLEWPLHELGFDFTYDKRLYDRLRTARPEDLHAHLSADAGYQNQCARFIENHDEPRAVKAFGKAKSLAAAMIMATVPGLRLYFDGQSRGRSIRIPVQLIREPAETTDPVIKMFYRELLETVNDSCFHAGTWNLLKVFTDSADQGDPKSLFSWCWQHGIEGHLVVVNFSEHSVKCRIDTGRGLAPGVKIIPQVSVSRIRAGEVDSHGRVPVELGPWGCFIARFRVLPRRGGPAPAAPLETLERKPAGAA